MNHAQFWGGGGAAPYEIEQSLRFDGSAQLSWTPSSAGNLRTFTRSAWFKRAGKLDGYNIFASGINMTPDSGHTSQIYLSVGSSPESLSWKTTADWRDVSAWYHLVFQFDTTQATADDRAKLYINGVRVTDFWQKNSTPAQNYQSNTVNAATAQYIGGGYSNWYFDGYQAEHIFVDGQALDPEDFGEFDENGVWRPKRYTGSYGTNGFYLKFDPTATNGIGHDHSGNGNNWTPTGFDTTNSTASTYDVMSDTPTTNYCTWNPISNNGVTISNGNLDTSGGSFGNCKGTLGMTSGKWYWEYSNMVTGTGTPFVMGLAHVDGYTPNGHDNWRRAVYFYTDGSGNGEVKRFENGSNVSADAVTVPSSIREFVASDVLQIAFDADTGEVWTGKNDSWLDSSGGFTGNPSNGSNPTHTFPDTTIPMTPLRDHAGVAISASANFGQRAFAYTPPTGFKALNTSNLPAPTVKDGSQYFNTVTYAGNGGSNTITTGMDHSSGGGLLWIKNRTTTANHDVLDNVRGLNQLLELPSTAAEYTYTSSNLAATSTGYTLNTSSGQFNASSNNYVAWNWLAGGSGSSNTDGSITSTVSANPTAGFSIVSYTGNGQANATVGHGLGVAPKLIIVKDRDAGRDWAVQHESLGATKGLYLNLTNAASTDSGLWSNTAPTSTVFTVGTAAYTNYGNLSSGDDFIAYCFAEVEGYSKFGSYTGNGSSDGPFVYCGFKPAWVLTKRTDSTGNWYLQDATRSAYNLQKATLFPDLSNAEATDGGLDFLSNGFKLRNTDSSENASGGTYIFAAFSENPFGGSGVSPATAR